MNAKEQDIANQILDAIPQFPELTERLTASYRNLMQGVDARMRSETYGIEVPVRDIPDYALLKKA